MNLRLFLSSVIVSSIAITAQSNEKLNMYGSIGYGFGSGGQLFSSTTIQNSNITERKDRYLNYGQGLKIDLGMQYYMMENVAVQAGFCYTPGVPGLKTENRYDLNLLGAQGSVDSTVEYHRNMFGIKAMVVPLFEIFELLDVHAGVGLGFYWNSLSYKITQTSPVTTLTENGSIKSAPSLGLNGLLGVDYPLSDLLSLFGEIGLEMTSFRWTKQMIKNTEFNRATGSYNFEKNTPNQRPPLRVSGSNWRLSFGVRYAIK
jgi:opacity protein-like surface antigen